jgi:hypothetical protein
MMKSIPWMAAIAAMGIAIGFLIGRNTHESSAAEQAESRAPRKRSAEASGGQRDRNGRIQSDGEELLNRFTRGKSVQSLSAADVTEIIRANVNTDPNEDPLAAAKRNFQLQLLLSKLPVGTLGEVTRQVMGDDKLRTAEGYKIFGVWANRDWKAAFEWAEAEPKGNRWAGQALSVLAATDPGLATQLMSERMLSWKGNDGFSLSYGIGRAHARMGTDALMQFVEGLPVSEQSNVLINSVRDLPEGELLAMVERLHEKKGRDGMQDYVFNNAFSELVKSNPEKARAWLDTFPPGEEKATMELTVVGYLANTGKADEAVAYMTSVMASVPGKEKDYLKRIFRDSQGTDPEMIAKLADTLPPGVEMTAADFGESGNFGYGNRTGFINNALLIRDSGEKVKYLTGVFDKASENASQGKYGGGFNDADFRILESRLASLKLSPDEQRTLTTSLQKYRDAMKNKGNDN